MWAKIALVLLAIGCASTPGGMPLGGGVNDGLIRVVGGGDFGFAFHGSHVVGPKIDLTIDGNRIHGVLGGGLIKMTIDEDKVYGSGNLGAFTFTSEEQGPDRIIRGVYGPYKLHLRLGADKIDGSVIRSWFLERASDGVYRGSGAEFRAGPGIMPRITETQLSAILVLALANLAMDGQVNPGPVNYSNTGGPGGTPPPR